MAASIAGDGPAGGTVPALPSSAALVVAAVLAPVAVARSEAGVSPLARVDVVGAGPIAWERVAVRSRPSRSAPVVASSPSSVPTSGCATFSRSG